MTLSRGVRVFLTDFGTTKNRAAPTQAQAGIQEGQSNGRDEQILNALRAVSGECPSRRSPRRLVLGFAVFDGARNDASALPSFARQTGQTCSTCHTAFPQLTPYGRRFKLGGYTAGGGIDTQLPPLSVMVQSEFTHLNRGLDGPAGSTSAYAAPQPPGLAATTTPTTGPISRRRSAFSTAARSTAISAPSCNGPTARITGSRFSWDNTDVRYADTLHIGPFDVLWGLDFNNNPTVQDPWNTTPAWGVPFISSPFAPGPAASTLLEGSQGWGPGQVVGAGGYRLHQRHGLSRTHRLWSDLQIVPVGGDRRPARQPAQRRRALLPCRGRKELGRAFAGSRRLWHERQRHHGRQSGLAGRNLRLAHGRHHRHRTSTCNTSGSRMSMR